MILLDTNVLVYALNARAPQHAACRQVVSIAVTGDMPGVLLPQVLIECYSVITSPRRMPRALSPQQARTAVRFLSRAIEVRAAPESMLDDLDTMLEQHPRRGRDVFDLAIVAQMRAHDIRAICTCNVGDFTLGGIQAIDPDQALALYA